MEIHQTPDRKEMRKRVNLLHQNFAALLFEVIGF